VPSRTDSEPRLWGRRAERQDLDRLLVNARAGTSGALVVLGEAGVGKSALLDYLIAHAAGCRIARVAGVESEMELAFAGLHQLCAPFLDRLDRLPAPQRGALGTAFGLLAGEPPDRFLVGLAVLSLLADVAEDQPLICLLDDAHWLDQASAQVLGFVARRLAAESVVVIFAVRQPWEDGYLAGLPELAVGPLHDADARDLLTSAIPGRLDESVRDRIVAEARGNPLALLELPRSLTPAALAGGFGLPDGVSVSGRIEESFRRRLGPLPRDTRRLLLVAAAEPIGDPALIWAAAERLGIPVEAAAPATAAGLLDGPTQLRFRHPLVRSVVYNDAPPADRQLVHGSLAEVTDSEHDADRRAWHRAQATPGPDDEVAAELEQSAGRAQSRGGIAAAAAFLQRAVVLTRESVRRTDRALAAAQASLHAGEFDAAMSLLAAAETGSLDEVRRARTDLLRGQIAFASGVGSDAPPLLLKAAKRLERIDVDLARETYLDAWGAALFAGRLATDGDLLEVSGAARSAPATAHPPRPADELLDGLATLITEGRSAAAPILRRATTAFAANEVSTEENFRWGWLTTVPSNVLWDDKSWHAINARQLQRARDAGALARLPIDLTASAVLSAWWGDFASAAAAIAEADAVTEATGTRIAPYAALLLTVFRGREAEAIALIDSAIKDARSGGQGIGVQYAQWVAAILFNGLGRYDDALAAARQASEETPELFLSGWALPELIEASTRSGNPEPGVAALERLAEVAAAAGGDWALGIEARSRALLRTGEIAESLYLEAIDRLAGTRLRPELARAYLLYGEWLRRDGRRVDARGQLRRAHDLFAMIGMEAFAERARRELQATGEIVRKRSVETLDELTAQELQIARLASEGRTNSEIGAQLFLSPRTVEWHLRNVFSKLGITSRRELHAALPQPAHMAVAV
jgi:DNA-binding CsgD family transcriptional regulator/tetratricopeptide (TPR) repeat protein